MIFLTYWFVVFADVFFPVYWLVRSPVPRQWVLLAGCVVFHAHFAGPAGVLPIAGLGILTSPRGRSVQPATRSGALNLNVRGSRPAPRRAWA